MKNLIGITVIATYFVFSYSSCSNANADGVTLSTPSAPFRLTRTAFPYGASINQLDSQCVSEFGSQYTTATSGELSSLASFVPTDQRGIYTLQLDTSTGSYHTTCGPTFYCAVFCIKK